MLAEKKRKKADESLLKRGFERRNEKMSSKMSEVRCSERVTGELPKSESVRSRRKNWGWLTV